MRCANCGADIPKGMLICPDCRTEVQMVPDYNPLEDVLAREVRGAVEDATRPLQVEDVRRYRERLSREAGNATRVLSQGELDDIRAGRPSGRQTEVWRQTDAATGTRGNGGGVRDNREMRSRRTTGEMRSNTGRIRQNPVNMRPETGRVCQNTGNVRPETGRVRQNTGNVRPETGRVRQNTGNVRSETDRSRQQMIRRKRALKKRRQLVLTLFLFFLVILGAAGFVIYQNSYAGVVNKGYRALQTGDYSSAEKAFQRAIRKDSKKADAYTGMAQMYIQQKTEDKGEDVLLKVIDAQPTNVELYQAAIDFYVKTEQKDKISSLLEGCEDKVLAAVSGYVSEMPEFSLDEGTYPEVQQVALNGEGTIYYTTDNTEPTKSSTKYEEPVLLDEGTTTIRAVSYNKKGIPSLITARTYTIEIPVEDAPAVTPSTGQYTEATQITIQVPEGYKAYYTMDGTTPSAGSNLYTGPLDMPEGTTIFSAILISDNGKMTQITKRNYLLEY